MILQKENAVQSAPRKFRVHYEFKQNSEFLGILSDKKNRPLDFSSYREAYKAKRNFQQKTGCQIACVVAVC